MKCKFCGAELEEGKTLCPDCGKDNAEKQKANSAILVVGIACLVVLIAIFVAIIVNGLPGSEPEAAPSEPQLQEPVTVDPNVPELTSPRNLPCPPPALLTPWRTM